VLGRWFHCVVGGGGGGGGDDDDYDDDDAAANCISSGTYTEWCFSISSMQVKQNHG